MVGSASFFLYHRMVGAEVQADKPLRSSEGEVQAQQAKKKKNKKKKPANAAGDKTEPDTDDIDAILASLDETSVGDKKKGKGGKRVRAVRSCYWNSSCVLALQDALSYLFKTYIFAWSVEYLVQFLQII